MRFVSYFFVHEKKLNCILFVGLFNHDFMQCFDTQLFMWCVHIVEKKSQTCKLADEARAEKC